MAESEDEVRAAGEAERLPSDEIREDIERTRMELEETVDALGEKLSPRRMAQEGWQAVKTSSEQQANRLVRIAREHPIPLSLIGVGVTWWVVESRRRSRQDWSAYRSGQEDYAEFSGERSYVAGAEGFEADAYGATSNPGSEGYGETRSRIANAAENVRDRASDAAHRAGEVASQAGGKVRQMASDAGSRVSAVASQAGGKVRQMASDAGSRVSDVAGTVKDRAVDLGRKTGHQARRAREGYWDLVQRRPIAAGMATLAAGLLVGLLVPNTRRENR